MVFRLILLVIISNFVLISPAVYASVEVNLNGTKYAFSDNPRLVDVLSPIALQEQWYWPASKLFRNNTQNAEELRKVIVAMLATETASDGNKASIHKLIASQINSWELADRITIKIDFELARIKLKHNPSFESGRYQIELRKRPTNLYVFGAITKAIDMPYTNNTCIEDIMSKIEFSENADKSFVHLITPQGTIQELPIGYWNSNCSLPMPGSMIYVPLLKDPFSNTSNMINTKLTELAINRVTTQ